MHPTPPLAPVVVLPPLAPGYAWTFTPHGLCPMPYDGPTLTPIPATATMATSAAATTAPTASPAPAPALPQRPASPPKAPAAPAAPATPPAHAAAPAAGPLDAPDPLAGVPPAILDRAEHDARIARALGDLVEAREAQEVARLDFQALVMSEGPFSTDPEHLAAKLKRLFCDRTDVRAAFFRHKAAMAASERALQAVNAAAQPPPSPERDQPAPSLAANNPAPTAPLAAPLPDLHVAAQLRDRDPAVAHALAAHTQALEHARDIANQCAALIARHGPLPQPHAAAVWLRELAEREPLVALAIGATLSASNTAKRTSAQLAASLAPYTSRAPPHAFAYA